MSHYDQRVWESYLRGEITGDAAAILEGHLYQCDDCLETYSTYLELHSSLLPNPLDGDVLTDGILTTLFGPNTDQIDSNKGLTIHPVSLPGRLDRWRSLRNYLIAAAATIILMVTGVFNGLFEQVGDFQSRTADRQTSVSEKLVNQTVIFLEDIHPKKP